MSALGSNSINQSRKSMSPQGVESCHGLMSALGQKHISSPLVGIYVACVT